MTEPNAPRLISAQVVSELDAHSTLQIEPRRFVSVDLRSLDGEDWLTVESSDPRVVRRVTTDGPRSRDGDEGVLFEAVERGRARLLVRGDQNRSFEVGVSVQERRPKPTLPEMPTGSPVTWEELLNSDAHEPVSAAEGTFVEQRDGTGRSCDFIWLGNDQWQAFDRLGSGGIQLGRTVVLVEEGVEIYRNNGGNIRESRLSGGHFRDALRPLGGMLGFDPGVAVTAVDEIEYVGRSCWQLEFGYEGTFMWLTVDRDTGVQLRKASEGRSEHFTSIRFNHEVRAAPTDWMGPVDEQARPGIAYIADDPTTGLFGGHIEVDAGPCGAMTQGPEDASIREVLAWARSRARRVRVRWRGRHFSGGEVAVGGPEVPLDEIGRAPAVTPELVAKVKGQTDFMRRGDTPTWRWLRSAIESAGADPDQAVVAAVLPESIGEDWPLTVVVTQDEQVLTLDEEVARLARDARGPGQHEFDDRLEKRWQDSRVRDEVAAALEIVRGEG